MATNDVFRLGGDGFRHCEYDKGSGPHCADCDQFMSTQDENEDKQHSGSQQALQDVIFPKLFEFTFYRCLRFHIWIRQKKNGEVGKNWGTSLVGSSPSLQNPFWWLV